MKTDKKDETESFLARAYRWLTDNFREVVIITIFVLVVVPLIVSVLSPYVQSEISADGLLAYIAGSASILSALLVGFVAVAQNEQIERKNEELQKVQQDLNKRMFDLKYEVKTGVFVPYTAEKDRNGDFYNYPHSLENVVLHNIGSGCVTVKDYVVDAHGKNSTRKMEPFFVTNLAGGLGEAWIKVNLSAKDFIQNHCEMSIKLMIKTETTYCYYQTIKLKLLLCEAPEDRIGIPSNCYCLVEYFDVSFSEVEQATAPSESPSPQ